MKLHALMMAALISGAPMMLDDGCCEEQTWYEDADGDGYGNAAESVSSCDQPEGYVEIRGDCADFDPMIFPGAEEFCDGLDNDCDGSIDEDACEPIDRDGDGYPADIDCDDGNPRIFPGAEEFCDGLDNDCDGVIDEEGCAPVDRDGDGYPAGEDCDDSNPRVNPGAEEICDGIDNNCNGRVDEEGCEGVDRDGDGFPAGEDCDDNDPQVNPGAPELCDDIDNNCNGEIDEEGCEDERLCAATGGDWALSCGPATCEFPCGSACIDCLVPFYSCQCPEDAPFWDEEEGCVPAEACEEPIDQDGDGYLYQDDCDDFNPRVNPGAEEICDGIDNNCNGRIDEEGCEVVDADGDGYPEGRDCDDSNPRVNPGAEEVCDGIDNNCDGQVDEYCQEMRLCEATGGEWAYGCGPATCEFPCGGECVECLAEMPYCECPAEAPYWDVDAGCISADRCEVPPRDADGDGFPLGEDCDDNDASVYPGAREVCDRVDNDCDGIVDEGCR